METMLFAGFDQQASCKPLRAQSTSWKSGLINLDTDVNEYLKVLEST